MGRKFTIFASFYFVFEGKFQAYIRRGDLTDGFLRYEFGGLIFGGPYTWRGLFSEFYGIRTVSQDVPAAMWQVARQHIRTTLNTS